MAEGDRLTRNYCLKKNTIELSVRITNYDGRLKSAELVTTVKLISSETLFKNSI